EGLLVVSTPNRNAYGRSGSGNPFHCSEMSEEEFSSLIAARFAKWRIYTQRTLVAPWWSPRSLAAVNSPWLRLRGFGRLRDGLRSIVCPYARGEVSEIHRQAPIEAILATDLPLSKLVNEYAVRERSRPCQDESEYL